MKTLAFIAATAVIAAATSSSAAQFVVNGNFTELTNGVGQLNNGTTTATGWTTTGYNYVLTSADVGANGQFGNFTLWDNTNYEEGPTGTCGATTCNPVGNSWNGLAPTAGNFAALDGDFTVGALSQTITGLTAGHTYTLSFNYAFGQQTGFDGDTVQYLTETLVGQSFTSSTFDVPSHGFTGWQSFSTTITATTTSEVLTFLATGNLPVPPFAMISNVSLTGDAAPEPASWAMMIVGMGGIGAMARRRRASGAASA
jgi:X-X-X-Leu-X-X-Gly heptad repeat protein